MKEYCYSHNHDAGFEARGLIFGAPLALALNIPFVPLRKPGKLPGTTIRLFFYSSSAVFDTDIFI